jgi:ABC-type antimicrobial peptide transport system permease subunit
MAATAILIFMLSLRIRKREIETMHRIGIPKSNVLVLLGTEIGVVLVLSMILALSLTLLLARFGESIIHNILL